MNEVDNEYALFQQQMAAAAEADVQKKSMENFGGFTDTMPGEHDPVSPWLSKLPKNVGIGLIDAAVNAADQIGRAMKATETGKPEDVVGVPKEGAEHAAAAYNAMRQHVIDFRNGLAAGSTASDEMTQAVAQYAIPAMGFTKLIGGLQGLTRLGTVGRLMTVEAATAMSVLAPHDQRAADLMALARETEGRLGTAMNSIDPSGVMLNGYINWMTDRTNESDFEGTVKNVIDNLGMAGLTAGLFTTGAKALKMTWKLPGYIGENLGPGPVGRGGQKGMVTFHGTDRTFPPTAGNPLGEFDLGKIGTGEGAQAQGYGVYLAQVHGTARTYMPNVEQLQTHLDYLKKSSATGDGGYGQISAEDRKYNASLIPEVERKIREATLYHVDLPDEKIAKMLDWDKPVLEQDPHIIEAFQRSGILFDDTTTGAEAYEKLAARFQPKRTLDSPDGWKFIQQGDKAASEYLLKHGIPGTKYLDQQSRAAGEGTRNFVIFDPKIATIVKKE